MATTYASIRRSTGLSSRATLSANKNIYHKPISRPPIEPFGPMVANDLFEIWGNDEPEECNVGYSDESYPDTLTPPEDYWYQTELPLENVRELEDRLRAEIQQFQRAYKKMMIYALKWHYLMDECEDSAQVEKMFNDMQMIRKLTGSDKV